MRVSYELNPPKILDPKFNYTKLLDDINEFKRKVDMLKGIADIIHITDSVMGVARISPLSIIREIKDINVRCSVRVRDRNFLALLQIVTDAIIAGVEGLLIVKGDKPTYNSKDSGLKPSEVVKTLNELGFNNKIKFFLSISPNPTKEEIDKKLDAEPYGFITQTISSLDELIKVKEMVNGYKVIPCIMIPSEKNRKSAEALRLDWTSYKEDPYSFIKGAYNICGEVLMTSPRSFDDGLNILRGLKGW